MSVEQTNAGAWRGTATTSLRPVDPFADVPDPALYVPRDASDLALARLEVCARQPRRPCLLLAPPGHGKTLLLHSLVRLLPERTCVYVPNPTLSPGELCAWTLDRLGAPACGDPTRVLTAYAQHLAGLDRTLVWMLDDAHGLGDETAAWLRRMQDTHPSLRLVLAAIREPPAALGRLERIESLARPMTASETRAYLERRLERAGDACRAPDEPAWEAIHRDSGGVPRVVCAAAASRLAEAPRWTRLQALV